MWHPQIFFLLPISGPDCSRTESRPPSQDSLPPLDVTAAASGTGAKMPPAGLDPYFASSQNPPATAETWVFFGLALVAFVVVLVLSNL
jgi:hypothetical protein